MLLGLVADGEDRLRGNDRKDDDLDSLTEEDLDRIRSVAATPRFRRTPEMLCPDSQADDGTDGED